MKGNEMGDNYLKVPASDPIPLSILELDLPAPTIGWAAGLAEKGVDIVTDDLGRLCVARADARRLFDEQRESEARAREMASENERQAIARDRAWRASLPRGAAWYDVPAGVHPATAMLQRAKDAQPRRTPSQVEWMFGEADTMVYHELPAEDDAS
jgi:hypothetical protein